MSAAEKPQNDSPLSISRAWILIFSTSALAGLLAFLWGITGPAALRAWQAYLINFVYWTGLSCGAVLFVAVLNMTNAVWGRPLKRLAEALGTFLPASFILFWVLYFGKEKIFPWIKDPISEKQSWLNPGFLFARDGVGLFLLTAFSLTLIYYSVKGDKQAVRLSTAAPGEVSTQQTQEGFCWRAQRALSPVIGILYAFVLSLLAFDLIMSLDPHWYSTLFGAYYFMGSFYLALAALYFLSFLGRNALGLKEIIHPHHLHDLGKLVFAFCVFTGYLFYVQFLVIWYGNLPEETRYVILRVKLTPWEPIAWIVLATTFVIPFLLLLRRKIKMAPLPMMILSGIILAGMWGERFLLIAPSLWEGEGIPLGFLEILITAGFVGIMGLGMILFLERVPLLPISDPLFQKALEPHEEKETP
jgi:hypothetical protein